MFSIRYISKLWWNESTNNVWIRVGNIEMKLRLSMLSVFCGYFVGVSTIFLSLWNCLFVCPVSLLDFSAYLKQISIIISEWINLKHEGIYNLYLEECLLDRERMGRKTEENNSTISLEYCSADYVRAPPWRNVSWTYWPPNSFSILTCGSY